MLGEDLRIVAVVDDDPSSRIGVERLLNAHAYATRGYVSGEAFLENRGRGDFACVVVDIVLQGMSGIELRRRIEESGWRIPVIFITGIDNEALQAEAIRSGCVAWLRKPFPAASLISAVEQALADPHRGSQGFY